MLDHQHLPTPNGAAQVFYFEGNSVSSTLQWITWQKPRGKSMIDILLVGKGQTGGNGAVGANSTAAGGGGGGSGGQTRITMPLHLLPDILYLSLAGRFNQTLQSSYVSIAPNTTANNVLAIANGGGSGGAASGATAGSAGSAGAIATAATMPLGWAWATVLAGQAGIIGGTTVAGGALTLPLTGLIVTGGTGGGGLPAAATAGTNGGAITAAGLFLGLPGGLGDTTGTTAAGNGAEGFRPIRSHPYGYGGTGGGSTHGSATGGGLVAGNGGNGAPGCGGGGGGGGLTGSTTGTGGLGGPAFCYITVW